MYPPGRLWLGPSHGSSGWSCETSGGCWAAARWLLDRLPRKLFQSDAGAPNTQKHVFYLSEYMRERQKNNWLTTLRGTYVQFRYVSCFFKHLPDMDIMSPAGGGRETNWIRTVFSVNLWACLLKTFQESTRRKLAQDFKTKQKFLFISVPHFVCGIT